MKSPRRFAGNPGRERGTTSATIRANAIKEAATTSSPVSYWVSANGTGGRYHGLPEREARYCSRGAIVSPKPSSSLQ